ncbi:conserved hypothetical protein [Rhodobacteraceae bacterium KLH11]|nr:conserved hypothetical protein [Rhodobacteraceae bacterium KLH11]
MSHPLDRLYRFETARQWAAGAGSGLTPGTGDDPTLIVPGALVAQRLSGTSEDDAGALLARDPMGRLVWMRRSGEVLVHDHDRAIRMTKVPQTLAASTRRLLWGQRFGWVLTDDQIVRLDTASGTRLGTFAAPGWHPEAIASDVCDGLLVVEVKDGARRIRRLRSDGKSKPLGIAVPEGGTILVPGETARGRVMFVNRNDNGWSVLLIDMTSGDVVTHPKPGKTWPLAAGPIARISNDSLALVSQDGCGIFETGIGHVGPERAPRWNDGDCCIGKVVDLQSEGDDLIASTESGLWRLYDDVNTAPAVRVSWVSPVLHSPPDERSGWQRADLEVDAPEGAEITISAQGLTARALAVSIQNDFATQNRDVLPDDDWSAHPISRHFGTGGTTICRHYLGDIKEQFLLLRIVLEVPACARLAGLRSLRVLYPRRSLIEHLPAIYRDGTLSELQMRRGLAGFQALIDEVDDKISAAVDRVDPTKADPVWSGFLLHWLGHGELSRLPPERRNALLQALPAIMQHRGTKAGLAGVMDILAPGAYAIEDSAEGPADWLLPDEGDPAGGRLGRDTRLGARPPNDWILGKVAPLGTGKLGSDCNAVSVSACLTGVTVRVFGNEKLKKWLLPFTEAIARNFAPANTHLRFVYSAHRPLAGLGFGPGLGDITLGPDDSRALGAWTLPDIGSGFERPDEPVRLDHSILNGNLVLE